MADHADDANMKIEILSLREAMQRRPEMYFGDHPAQDWPLVITAWTVTDLLEYAAAAAQHVDLMLHSTGALSAVVRDACVTTSVAGRLEAEELVRRKMWWCVLARSFTVKVQRAGNAPLGPPRHVDDELLWEGVDVEVIFEPDSDFFGVVPGQWWHDGPARLRQIFTAPHSELKPGQRVTVADEATGSVISIEGLS